MGSKNASSALRRPRELSKIKIVLVTLVTPGASLDSLILLLLELANSAIFYRPQVSDRDRERIEIEMEKRRINC